MNSKRSHNNKEKERIEVIPGSFSFYPPKIMDLESRGARDGNKRLTKGLGPTRIRTRAGGG